MENVFYHRITASAAESERFKLSFTLTVLIFPFIKLVFPFPCQTPDEWLSGNISLQRTGFSRFDPNLPVKWPNGVVKYKFNETLALRDKSNINKAFEEYHKKTCIRFQPWQKGDIDFVSIEVDNSICGKANVCKIGGYQYARFGGKCLNTATMIHQLGHTICLGHEHQRADRDEYLSFPDCTTGISPKVAPVIPKGIYDYASRMHGECDSCTVGHPPTYSIKCGQSSDRGLSVLDADAINSFYNCGGCQRHRWIPVEQLSPEDQRELTSFGNKTQHDSSLYACRAPISSEVTPGLYDAARKLCYIGVGLQTKGFDKNVEVLSIPGGFENNCSVYQFVNKDKVLGSNDALQVGELFKKEDSTSHLALGVIKISNESSYFTLGKVWNRGTQNFMFLQAVLPTEFSFPGSVSYTSDYKVLTCTMKPLCKVKKSGSSTEPDTRRRFGPLAVALLIFMLILLAIIAYHFKRLRNMKAKLLSEAEEKEFLEGNVSGDKGSEDDVIHILKFEKEYELSREDITIDMNKVLGMGTFGIVYNGTAKDSPAAIKIPKDSCAPDKFKSFLSEVKVLCHLGSHPNILGFLGAHVAQIRHGILHIATELCMNGSLQGFLRKKKRVTQDNSMHQTEDTVWLFELYRFAIEIARGMEYIASKKVVHGDLSTRNVFLDADNVCKIGDFGLSRKLDEYDRYVKESQEPMPWKWLAYESLTKMEFTCKSDVWGYGVTVWEILSLGNTPYAGLTWSPEFTTEIENGLRLPPPTFGEPEIYSKLQDCWHLDPNERTTCTHMLEFFKKFCDTEYVSLEEYLVETSCVSETDSELCEIDTSL